MVVTIILGATFTPPQSNHLQILSSRQRHDSPTEFTSSTLLVLQHFALFQILLSLIRVHQVTGHPQAEIINSQLSISKARLDIKITKTQRFIFPIKTT